MNNFTSRVLVYPCVNVFSNPSNWEFGKEFGNIIEPSILILLLLRLLWCLLFDYVLGATWHVGSERFGLE